MPLGPSSSVRGKVYSKVSVRHTVRTDPGSGSGSRSGSGAGSVKRFDNKLKSVEDENIPHPQFSFLKHRVMRPKLTIEMTPISNRNHVLDWRGRVLGSGYFTLLSSCTLYFSSIPKVLSPPASRMPSWTEQY